MAFRNPDHDFGRLPEGDRENWPGRRGSAEPDETKLSLNDTLRELAVTILGFVGVIVAIMAAVAYFSR